jgi:serine/threonine protein kinase/Tfp pilus assembly protein PilF
LIDFFFSTQAFKGTKLPIQCPKCKFSNPTDTLFCGKCAAQLPSSKNIPASQTETWETPRQELTTGFTLSSRYQIIEELGRGGMGKVFRVLDKKLNEEIALKLLKPDIARSATTLDRFRNEVKLARKIIHKNVGRIYHLSEEGRNHFITMEYIQGQDLRTLIRQTERLTVSKSLSFARQICEGLGEAHRLGVIHRDLKPSNIMIDKDGNARIMDFGIAHSLKTDRLTDSGIIIGTPEYMSPEQVEAREIDQRSDIYSFGIILYEMLTGKVPFEGETPISMAVKHLTSLPQQPIEINRSIPENINRIIMKCLEKDRARRYQDSKELLEEIRHIEEKFPIEEKAKSKIKWRFSQRSWLAVLLILSAIVIFGGYHIWNAFIRSSPDYENFILIELTTDPRSNIDQNIIDFLLQRSLSASTNLNILIQDDIPVYKKKTESIEATARNPLLAIDMEVFPKASGFSLILSIRNKKKSYRQTFECKGFLDFITDKIEKIHSFISEKSDGLVKGIDRNRAVTQISTGNYDALNHFLKGEEAWKKLNTNEAYSEYKTAIENSPEFSLAHLKLAEVHLFREDQEDAKRCLNKALEHKNGLIEYDLHRLEALLARIESNAAKERQHLAILTEAFPFKKEYLYEFGESYFFQGDAEEAIKHYLKALEVDPNFAKAHNHIAFCYSWTGNHELAEQHFKRYVELDKTANAFDSLAYGCMFAGNYLEAIEAVEEGKGLDPDLDYLYTNLCKNYILTGQLEKAAQSIDQQAKITDREATRFNALFYKALIEFSRSDLEESLQELTPVIEIYSDEIYANRLEESPALPFWLRGMIAAEKGDSKTLKAMLDYMDRKIAKGGVNATNFSPIYKFYIHLKILEGHLEKDQESVMRHIAEGKRIEKKMGHWISMFDLSYFLNAYAEILMKLGRDDEALALLDDVNRYNPYYAAAHLNLCKIHLDNSDMEKAKEEFETAKTLLAGADQDFILVKELARVAQEFHL